MTVYLVWHNDIEDSKWPRGVFATRELAEHVATMSEDRYGDGYVSDHWIGCCEIEEYEVATEAPRVQAKPNPYRAMFR